MIRHLLIVLLMLAAFVSSTDATADAKASYEKAQLLESQGKIQEAMKILSDLYKNEGGDIYFWKLANLYEQEHDYENLGELMRSKLETDPVDEEAQRFLARAYYGSGKIEEGRRVLMDIYRHNRDNVFVVKLVGNEFFFQGDYESALEVYEDAGENVKLPAAFALEKARIYEFLENYPRALEEYLRSSMDVTTIYQTVRKVLENARAAGVPADELKRPLIEYLRSNPQNLAAARIVADMLYTEGNHDEAYHVLVRAAEKSGNPSDIWEFAEKAHVGGFDKLALEAYGTYYRLFPNAPQRVEALLKSAALKVALGMKVGAREDYTLIMNDYPGSIHAARAALHLLELSGDSVSFENHTAVIERYASTIQYREVAYESYLLLGSLYLGRGRGDEALKALSSAKIKARTNGELYEVCVRSARAHFFLKNYQAMNADIESCVGSGSDGEDINELLALKVLGMRCESPRSLKGFEALSDGHYALSRGDTTAAIEHFTRAASDSGSVTAPRAAQALAELLKSRGEFSEVVKWCLYAARATSDTTEAVGAVIQAADTAFQELRRPQEAKALYLEALTRYPGNVYESELRRKLRVLAE